MDGNIYQEQQIEFCNNCKYVSYDSNVIGIIRVYFCTEDRFTIIPLPDFSMACT